MSCPHLYLETPKAIFSHSLERALVYQLFLEPNTELSYQGKWAINGKEVSYNPHKKYSSIEISFLSLCHRILSWIPAYSERFSQAVQKLKATLRVIHDKSHKPIAAIEEQRRHLYEKKLADEKTLSLVEASAQQIATKTIEELTAQRVRRQEKLEHHQQLLLHIKAVLEKKMLPSSDLLDLTGYPTGVLEKLSQKDFAHLKKKTEKKLETLKSEITELNNSITSLEQKSSVQISLIREQVANVHQEVVRLTPIPLPRSTSEDLEEDDDVFLEAEDIDIESSSPTSLSHEEVFLNTLEEHLGPLGASPWRALFSHYHRGNSAVAITQFEKIAENHYRVHFAKPLWLWVSSTNEEGIEDPEGGVILGLGSLHYHETRQKEDPTYVLPAKNQLEFKISAAGLEFISGFETFAKIPGWAFALAKARRWVKSWSTKNPPSLRTFDVSLMAKMTLSSTNFKFLNIWDGVEKPRNKTIQYLVTNWGGNHLEPGKRAYFLSSVSETLDEMYQELTNEINKHLKT